LIIALDDVAFFWLTNCCFVYQASITTTTTTTTTTSTSSLLNHGSTSIPADNSSAFNVTMAAMTSPCEGCARTMTTFSVSGGQGHGYKSQSPLSTGEFAN